MGPIKTFLLFLIFKTCASESLDHLFRIINEETGNFSSIAANLAWESSVNPGNPELPARSATYQKNRIKWQHSTCAKLATLYNRQSLNATQRRQYYLLCRGPKFNFDETRITSNLYEELQSIYSDAEICIPTDTNTATNNLTQVEAAILNYLSNVKTFFTNQYGDDALFAAKFAVNRYIQDKNMICLKGESDFDRMMAFSRNVEVLRWLWLVWREKVGPPMKEPYRRLVSIENKAARRNGYLNIGVSWREELEVTKLREVSRQLYNTIKPLYSLLHGVMRFYLRRFYGDVVPAHGPIPAHLLGNLWSQNWEPLADLLLPRNIDLDENIRKLNWTVLHMAKRAEDFYQSLGLPAMTDTFWRESVFSRENNSDTRCHGTAADMFQDGDFRLLYCSDISKEDFYVLHHELGHIQYYMAYEQQPAIYRQANAALHETIGDAIMYGVLTPQHLNRLGLINDSLLYTGNNQPSNNIVKDENANNKDKDHNEEVFVNKVVEEKLKEALVLLNDKETPKLLEDKDVTTDTILLLKQALNKLPQIPFSLAIDEYRWKYFEGNVREVNKEFWSLVEELQGVAAPGERGESYFDAGAKFHVPDNTPYIRYFLSSFLQHQLFEKLCKAAIFGRRSVEGDIPETISLTRCDIYGSKAAGKILKDFMSRGHSQHWSQILEATIGEHVISASALNRYYRPLYVLLEKFVRAHRVPIGW
ncbi:angiotensin-converting enzyme-like [Spodoptera litura]|uniref:Angiotensin-converting enzyme n=1 Tax=Spodoptera litura TaxID=69820 RepID=A0A9J7DU75_SPOLT|nr:angiotensin-converting enzyme-like [Spodoptera litura]